MSLWGKHTKLRGIVYFVVLFSLTINPIEINGQVVSVNNDGSFLVSDVQSSKAENFNKVGFTSLLLKKPSYKSIREKSQRLRDKLKRKDNLRFKSKIGESRDFFVRNIITGDTWNTLEAVLSYKNEGINIWMEKAAYDTLINTTTYQSIVQGFERLLYQSTPEHSIDSSKGILELIEHYVGEFPDVDGDRVLDVLLLDIMDNFTETGSYVAGFFDPVNLYEHTYSNQIDLIYLDLNPTILYDGQINVENALSTFVHESQHLIHAGYEGNQTELIFINEGFSEATEIICGFEPRSDLAYQQNPIRGLVEWDHNNPLPDYSRASLWMHYLLEQLGPGSLKYFVQSPMTGILGYKEVIASISSQSFEELFHNWGLALTLNDIDTNPKYGYQHALRKQRVLNPQLLFRNLPVTHYEELPELVNIPASFYLTKDLRFEAGLSSISNIRVSSVSRYPGSDEVDIQNNSNGLLNAKADKHDFGQVEVIISNYGDDDSTKTNILNFIGDGEKSGRELSLGYGIGSPETFYRNASYLMLDGNNEKLGIIFPAFETEYWLKNIRLWTLFKSELQGGGVDANVMRDFEVGIYTYTNGRPESEVLAPLVLEVKRGFGKLVEESFDLSDYYERLSAINDTLILIIGNDNDDENYLALGLRKGNEDASYYSDTADLKSGWVSLSEKSIGVTSLENWNPALNIGMVIPKVEQYLDPSIGAVTYNFEEVRVNITPNHEYDSSSVMIVGELPDGRFTSGEFISKNENQFTFAFPVLVDGSYRFSSKYSSPKAKIDYRDERVWKIEIPHGFELSNNYPNPFNPTTIIPFLLLEEAKIGWQIFDITGRLVQEIPVHTYKSGEYTQRINLSGRASGMYFVRAKLFRERSKTTNYKTQKIMLIK